MIDWDLFSRIAIPLLTGALGIIIKDVLERRPRLICYYGYSAAIRVKADSGPVPVHTHSVVVANTGRNVAQNIRVGHHTLPDFDVTPDTDYRVVELPGGTKEILIPQLAPKEQVAIHYLYYAPLTYNGVTSYVKSDEGYAKVIRTLPTPQLPRIVIYSVWALACIGAATLLYSFARWVLGLTS